MSAVLEKLVEVSGLSPLFARRAIQRAVERCGVNLERLTPDDADRLSQDLERVIAIFDPSKATGAADRIRAALTR